MAQTISSPVIPSCKLRPNVRLFFYFTGHLDIGGVVSLKDTLQSHGQAITGKHLAVFGYASEIHSPPTFAPLLVDALLHSLKQSLK